MLEHCFYENRKGGCKKTNCPYFLEAPGITEKKKGVSIDPGARVQLIDSKDFIPVLGEDYFLKWTDNMVYRGRLEEQYDNGCYRAHYYHYGAGTATPGNIWCTYEDIPDGALIDIYILKEMKK